MPAILAYLAIRIGLVLADPRKSLRSVLASRSWRVWALWAAGVVIVLAFWELDPGLVVYLADPELLAGVVVLMAFQVRRSLRGCWQFAEALARRSLRRAQLSGTCALIGVRLYAASAQNRLVASG